VFQDDNVRNQRENVTLTLANAQSRLSLPNETEPVSSPFLLIWINLYKNISASGLWSLKRSLFLLIIFHVLFAILGIDMVSDAGYIIL